MRDIPDGTRAYCPPFQPMVDVLQETESTNYALREFEVSQGDAQMENLRSLFNRWDADVRPGRYMRLTTKGKAHGTLWVSDTPRERSSCLDVVSQGHGNVLIGGLGIGMIIVALFQKPCIGHVTVVEISHEIATLVGEQLLPRYDGRLTIVEGDILTFKPPKGTLYNTIYFDIWPDISADNQQQMTVLHRRFWHYLDRSDPDRWMSSWERDWVKSLVREDRRWT